MLRLTFHFRSLGQSTTSCLFGERMESTGNRSILLAGNGCGCNTHRRSTIRSTWRAATSSGMSPTPAGWWVSPKLLCWYLVRLMRSAWSVGSRSMCSSSSIRMARLRRRYFGRSTIERIWSDSMEFKQKQKLSGQETKMSRINVTVLRMITILLCAIVNSLCIRCDCFTFANRNVGYDLHRRQL